MKEEDITFDRNSSCSQLDNNKNFASPTSSAKRYKKSTFFESHVLNEYFCDSGKNQKMMLQYEDMRELNYNDYEDDTIK